MTRPAARWALALGASALLHAAAAGALLLSLTPEPPPQQPTPQSSLNLQAHRIPRAEAIPQPAKGAQATESKGKSQGLSAGDLPRSKAQSQPPPTSALAAATAPTAALPQTPATPTAAAQSQTSGRRLVGSAPPATQLPAAPMAASTPLPDTPAPPTPLATAQATPTALPLATPASQPSPETQPDTAPLPGTNPNPQHTPAAAPNAPRIKAALAFQGGSGNIDPLSLAAFQSFMQPGDATTDTDPLRDGLSGLLAAVPCARLQVAFVPETATLEVRGHLPEDGLRDPVLAALQAQMGADITVSDHMRLLPRPQCGALAGIASVGLPQSTDQITNPLLVGEDAHARVLDYSGGDRLFFDLTAPDYPAYVYVDYFDAGGSVLHLSPNETAPLTLSPPKSALRVGAKQPGDPGLQITVGPPYGQEIAVAFAASHVLFEHPRPLSEPAAPYLDALRARIAEARSQHTDFKGEWVYFLITTHAP